MDTGSHTNPRHGGDSRAKESDKNNDRDNENDTGSSDFTGFHFERVQIDRNVSKAYSRDDKSRGHAENGHEENLATTESVDDHQVYERKDKVGSRNRDRNGGSVSEADNLEESRAVVHKCVEAAQLRDGHYSASGKNSAEGGPGRKDTGQRLEDRIIDHGLCGLGDAHFDRSNLCASLFLGRCGIDAC